MKWIFSACILFLIPFQVLAVSSLKLNGVSEYTVTMLPEDVIMTCELSQAGNHVELETYLDVNNSGTLDGEDIVRDFMVLTDGIGWIRDPENPGKDIAGDETPVDGTLQSTASYEEDDEIFFRGRFIIKLTDEDGSTATALLIFDIPPQPPLITGNVIDAFTGMPIPNIIILAEGDVGEEHPERSYGLTDANGDYSVSVDPGTWMVVATDYVQNEYMSFDTAGILVAEGETRILNIQLQKYNSFLDGFTKKEDGTPVPGIQILATNIASSKVSTGRSDQDGYYKVGVDPGEIVVSVSFVSNRVYWPEGYYVDPAGDTVHVAKGQTVRSDFVFKPYVAFIEGDCKVDQERLSEVQITATSIVFQTMELHMSSALSDIQGHYRIGVMPGTVSMVTAFKEGYDLSSPTGGYLGISIAAGQTITGKDFVFTKTTGEMSLRGQVTYNNGNPAGHVYVVAILDVENSPAGYRIMYTDVNGNYQFDGLFEGYWKVGVYKKRYGSTPPMIYEFFTPGMVVTDANFVLYPSEVLKGDVNGDGEINIFDAIATISHIVGRETLDEDAFLRADCNGDGKIDVQDVFGIVLVILELGECEPAALKEVLIPHDVGVKKSQER